MTKPKAKKPVEPVQHRLVMIIKWDDTPNGSMDEMVPVLRDICTKLQTKDLADEIYLSVNNAQLVNYRKPKDG